MDLSFSPQQQDLRKKIISFSQEHLNDGVAQRVIRGQFSREHWNKCSEIGMHGLVVPTDFGGKGLNAVDMVAAWEAFGFGCEDHGLAFSIGAQLFACTIPLMLYGSEDQKANWLEKLASGPVIATNAMTEEQGGSAAFQMESRGIAKQDHFALSGIKNWCGNAPVSDLCIAYVLTDPEKGFFGGVTAFLLDRKTHSYEVFDAPEKPGLRTCSTGIIDLHGVKANEGDILGKAGGGGKIFNKSMEWERLGFAAWHNGIVERLMKGAIQFARERKPGGIPISRHQSISHRLSEFQVRWEAARMLVYKAAEQLDHNDRSSYYTSAAKVASSKLYQSFSIYLSQLYAGTAYQRMNAIAQNLNDAMAATIYSGTTEVQHNIISGWMGLNK